MIRDSLLKPARSLEDRFDDELGSSVEEVVAALRKRDDSHTRRRVRRSKRHEWRTEIIVDVDETPVGGRCQRGERVKTLDLSASGFAFQFRHFVAPGAIVVAQMPLPDQPRLEGTVCYCAHMQDTHHRVGVAFRRVLPTSAT